MRGVAASLQTPDAIFLGIGSVLPLEGPCSMSTSVFVVLYVDRGELSSFSGNMREIRWQTVYSMFILFIISVEHVAQ